MSAPPLRRRTASDVDTLDLAVSALAEALVAEHTGEPLEDRMREQLESSLGHDLRDVRIHRDTAAAELTDAVRADAFTVGTHIWFGAGRYQPATPPGRNLLVHEIAHISARREPAPGSRAADSAEPVTPQPVEEHHADAAADSEARAKSAPPERVDGHAARHLRAGVGMAKRAAAQGASVLAEVQPGRVLTRVIDSLLKRNPDDRGGRVKAVFARMERSTKSDVVSDFAERGGLAWSRLSDLLREKAPEDGGIDASEDADIDAEELVADAEGDAETKSEGPEAPGDATANGDAASDDEAVVGDGEQAPDSSLDQNGDVERLTFDPGAELDPEAEPDQPDFDNEPPEAAEEEEVAAEQQPEQAEGTPTSDAGPAAATPGPGGGEPADAGVDIEDELADALEPALAAQVPTEEEAEALITLQDVADGADEAAEPAEPAEATSLDDPLSRDDQPDPALDAALGGPALERGPNAPTDVESTARLSGGDSPGGGAASTVVEEPNELEVSAPGQARDAADELTDDSGSVDEAPDEGDSTAPAALPPGAAADVPADVGAPDAADKCAAPAPAPMEDPAAAGGGGGCGGGGGGAAESEAEAEGGDAAAADATPGGAVGAVGGLAASARPAALGAAGATATTEVSGMQDELASGPPSIARPSGVPGGRDASIPAATLPPPSAADDREQPGLEDASGGTIPEEKPVPNPGADVTARVPSPRLAGDTKITKDDVARVQKSVRGLPTTDAALDVSAGPAPTLVLDGEADPNRVTTQATGVVTTTTDLQVEANGHIVEDFGDRDIYPVVPKETLTAHIDVSTIAIAPSSNAADTGKVPNVVIDRLAEDESGAADRAAIAKEASGMATGRAKHDEDANKSRDEAKTDLDDAVTENAKQQGDKRQKVASASDSSRQSWVDATAKTSKDTRDATKTATDAADGSISTAETTARTDATTAVTDGDTKIKTAKKDAEKQARDKKAEAERKSSGGGFFSWLGSKVKSFFNGIKNAIKKAFAAARALVDKAIKAAQKLAVAAIEAGRKAAIAAIEIGGKALVAAGDIALAGFPGAREKWRSSIEAGVEAGKDAVNELADDLKAAAVAILEFLGKALKAYLSALEKLYTMAVEAVEAVVDGAIKFAKAVAEAFGDFLEIAADIARGPVSWLKKLGAGAVDGAKNCTWPSLKTAVKSWFKEKVEALVGVGKAVFDVLLKGCISFGQVAKLAWSAIKASLPVVLVQLLIEKLVAMLIPAGGALSLIIDGLRAAWGAAGRILAAFQAFIAFLKAVRAGQAAPKFGSMVGAAATAVLDFLSNFVLQRIMGAGKKVGGALKKTASKIMAQLKRAAAAAKRVAGKAAGAAKKAAKGALGAAKKAGGKAMGAVKTSAKKAGRAIAKTKVGKAVVAGSKTVGRGARKVVDKGKKALAKRKQKAAAKKKTPAKKKETPQQKLDKIAAKIRPKIEGWFDKGIGRKRLWAQLQVLRVRHRLRRLDVDRAGKGIDVKATLNPTVTVGDANFPGDPVLNRIVKKVAEEVLQEGWLADFDATDPGGAGYLARARDGQFPFRDPSDRTPEQRSRDRAAGGSGKAKGTRQTHLLGKDQIPVEEVRGWGEKWYSRQNWEVTALGFYDKSKGSSPAVVTALSGFGGGDDAVGAQRLASFMRTGTVPPGLEGQKKQLAAAAHLLFTRESARRVENVAHSAMMTELVQKGDMTFKDMVADPNRDPAGVAAATSTAAKKRASSGGALPVSMDKATPGGRADSPEQQIVAGEAQLSPGSKADAEELIKREAELTKKWLRSTGWSMNYTAGAETALQHAVAEHLRSHIRTRLRRFYGLKGTVR